MPMFKTNFVCKLLQHCYFYVGFMFNMVKHTWYIFYSAIKWLIVWYFINLGYSHNHMLRSRTPSHASPKLFLFSEEIFSLISEPYSHSTTRKKTFNIMGLTSINKYLKWNIVRWQFCNYCKIYIMSSHRQIGYLKRKIWTVAFSHQW